MNCEKCLAQLDDFLNGELCAAETVALEKHFAFCEACSGIVADLTVVFDSCHELAQYEAEPPNSNAMWLRISNLIESEQQAQIIADSKLAVAATTNVGWWTRQMDRSWKLSVQQMISAVLCIAVITSLLTFAALQNSSSGFAARANAVSDSSLFSQFLTQFGTNQKTAVDASRFELEDRFKQQQLAIEHWNQRVETRKKQWNAKLRDAFDRNYTALNQVVTDYKQQLQVNPEDKFSEEMLDSALNDQMQLLREFSEL